MNENGFFELFELLGIENDPIDEYYDPEDFGKRLMAEYGYSEGVSYSSSTDNVGVNQVYGVNQIFDVNGSN